MSEIKHQKPLGSGHTGNTIFTNHEKVQHTIIDFLFCFARISRSLRCILRRHAREAYEDGLVIHFSEWPWPLGTHRRGRGGW